MVVCILPSVWLRCHAGRYDYIRYIVFTQNRDHWCSDAALKEVRLLDFPIFRFKDICLRQSVKGQKHIWNTCLQFYFIRLRSVDECNDVFVWLRAFKSVKACYSTCLSWVKVSWSFQLLFYYSHGYTSEIPWARDFGGLHFIIRYVAIWVLAGWADTLSWQFLHYSGVSSLSFCLSQRVPRRWRQWKNLSWGRTCVLLVLFDSCVTLLGIFFVSLTACPLQLAFRIFLWVAIGLSNIDVLNIQSWFIIIWNRPLVVPHDLCSSCLRMYQLLCPQQSRSNPLRSMISN